MTPTDQQPRETPWVFSAGTLDVVAATYTPYAVWWKPTTWLQRGGTIRYALKYTPDPRQEEWKALRKATQEAEAANRTAARLEDEFRHLQKYIPPMAAKRARWIRLSFEAAGVAIAATGAWWIYPPAALLVVGAWMLGDVLAARLTKKRNN